MVNKKSLGTKGKLQLSRCFQELKEGDRVSVVREIAIAGSFPKRLQGRTGIVEEEDGKAIYGKNKRY